MPQQKPRRERKAKAHWLWFILVVLFGASCVACLICANGAAVLFESWLEDLPDYEAADAFNVAEPTTIYANDGETVLASLYLQNRIVVTIDEVSQYVLDGTVATEDERFYKHNGIDIAGIGRALVSNLVSNSSSEGASTITQQLVRNTILQDEMTEISIKRKVREAYLAIQLEKLYTKDEILMMYLNTVFYGSNSYGIEAASKAYFSKSSKDLTLAEAAMLVGIVQSPVALDPTNDYDASLERSYVVLDRMLVNNYITQEEYDEAKENKPVLNVSNASNDGIYQFPYFVSYVRDNLIEEYGYDVIFQGGLKVYTTLDKTIQKCAESAVESGMEGQSDSLECALCSIDPDTGYIVAMVGGTDFYEDQYNLATQAQRQAGSAFKTFALAAAIEKGISPSTSVNASTPAVIKQDDTETWICYNSGYYTSGTMTFTSALQSSVNVVFARLSHVIGAEATVDMAKRLGITSELDEVESIVLGVSGVTLLEMASAYATLADGGMYNKPICYTKIIDSKGEVFYEHTADPEQTVSIEVAVATVDQLKTVVTDGTAYSAKLSNGQASGGKTGTSEESRDCWYIGITPQLSTSIWIGSRTESTVYWNGYQAYGENCCPIWKSFMTKCFKYKKWEVEDFPTASTPKYDSSWAKKLASTDTSINYTGKTLEEAKSAASSLGLGVKVTEEYSDTVEEGIVISSSISNGKVVIVVSKGPDPSTLEPEEEEEEEEETDPDNPEEGEEGDPEEEDPELFL